MDSKMQAGFLIILLTILPFPNVLAGGFIPTLVKNTAKQAGGSFLKDTVPKAFGSLIAKAKIYSPSSVKILEGAATGVFSAIGVHYVIKWLGEEEDKSENERHKANDCFARCDIKHSSDVRRKYCERCEEFLTQ